MPGPWIHNLCDDFGPYVGRIAAWCVVLGGTWHGPYAPVVCEGSDPEIEDPELYPYADAFERRIHNVQSCSIQGTDSGWLSPGQAINSYQCWSGGPVYQNGIEIRNMREMIFSGQSFNVATGQCEGSWAERILALRTRQLVTGCPAGFTLRRSRFTAQLECFSLQPPECRLNLEGLPAEVEPGKTVANLAARVTCSGRSPEGIEVILISDVLAHTGGHQHHDQQRPHGSIGLPQGNITDASGAVTFHFTAPAPAGDHSVTATCADPVNCGTETGRVWVGIKNLKWQAASAHYVLLPNPDTNHPGNHYVASQTEEKVANLAAAYHERFPSDPVLHLNDASLERGGLFDIAGNWSSHPGHETHKLGRNVDVRANEFYHDSHQSIPTSNYIDFWNMGATYGCYVALHSGGNQNEHFHLHCP